MTTDRRPRERRPDVSRLVQRWQEDRWPEMPTVEIDLAPGTSFRLAPVGGRSEAVRIVDVIETDEPRRPVVIVESPTHGRLGLRQPVPWQWHTGDPHRAIRPVKEALEVATVGPDGLGPFDRRADAFWARPEPTEPTRPTEERPR